ncbi:MAG TPA: hypothetical protein VJ302_00380 [Blastocatellia bacterium]|nr:hypothetical protein [Blastocatellia bacterium]
MSTHTKEGERKFERPVAWLLGRQLLGSIKGILLYTAYGKRLDPRDWMRANVFPSRTEATSLAAWRERRFERDPRTAPPSAAVHPDLLPKLLDQERGLWRERGEFWFDYLSDTGDGMTATYSLAYLCLSNLYVKTLDPSRLAAGDQVRVQANKEASTVAELPRGEFLFVGGDTAYHVSDYMTLANRIQRPYRWAYQDLVADGGLDPQTPNRPLLGIPGNHDYYDQLNGFRRQFRHSVRDEPSRGAAPESSNPSPEDLVRQAQLFLPGFNRYQQASYLALQLPFGWQFWGLDTEVGQIDERQRKFFRDLCEDDPASPGQIVPPPKLIVATCVPSTVFGKLATPNDGKAVDAYRQLGLSSPFLPTESAGAAIGGPDLQTTGDVQMKAGECRLDLAGDIHHYARYWGPPPTRTDGRTPREGAETRPPSAQSYASVVSGIGGAFHHPSATYLDEVQEQTLYPSEAESTAEVARRIFKPWNIVTGGYVWLAGLVVAFTIYFAATIPPSSRQVINNFPLIKWLRLAPAQPEPISPTAIPWPTRPEDFPQTPIATFWGQVRATFSMDPAAPTPVVKLTLASCGGASHLENPYLYFYGPCAISWPWELRIGALVLLFSIVPLLAAVTSRRLFRKEEAGSLGTDVKKPVGDLEEAAAEGTPASQLYIDPEIYANPDKWLWLSVVISALAYLLGLLTIRPYRTHITPFGNSIIILFSIIWAATAWVLSSRYSEFLFKKSHYAYIHKYDWALTWVLSVLSIVGLFLGLWLFGGNNLPVWLVSDMVFMLVLGGALIALFALPFKVGADLLQPRSRAVRRSRAAIGGSKFLIGLWHAVLQIGVPLILVKKGTPLILAVAAALIMAFSWIGAWLLKRNHRRWLVWAWVGFGGLMLASPYLIAEGLGLDGPILAEGWTGWWGPLPLELVPVMMAAVVGALIACVWLGWYLAVCFVFNGHNNEVGGAARIERFKQFIRFRLTEDGLTGYVIGIDDPQQRGRDLKPRIVDVFHLRVKDSSEKSRKV